LFKIKIGETQMNFITKIFTDYSEFTKFLNDAGGLGGVVNKANINGIDDCSFVIQA
jgi:hypothetical protein